MAESLIGRLFKSRQAKKLLTAQEKQQLVTQIQHALLTTDQQCNLYKTNAATAVLQARKALANNDSLGKATAMRELKMYYGFFHYMKSLHSAFRVLEGRLAMQEATQELVDTVKRLSTITQDAKPVNWAKMTAKITPLMQNNDQSGLDAMVDTLMQASSSDPTGDYSADDVFFEELISGKRSLRVPNEAPLSTAKGQNNHEEILALLEQLSAKLRD